MNPWAFLDKQLEALKPGETVYVTCPTPLCSGWGGKCAKCGGTYTDCGCRSIYEPCKCEKERESSQDADLAAAGQRIAELERVLRQYAATCEHCSFGVRRSLGPARPCSWCYAAREALGQTWTGERWEQPA